MPFFFDPAFRLRISVINASQYAREYYHHQSALKERKEERVVLFVTVLSFSERIGRIGRVRGEFKRRKD